jgi:hypothetical protein
MQSLQAINSRHRTVQRPHPTCLSRRANTVSPKGYSLKRQIPLDFFYRTHAAWSSSKCSIDYHLGSICETCIVYSCKSQTLMLQLIPYASVLRGKESL